MISLVGDKTTGKTSLIKVHLKDKKTNNNIDEKKTIIYQNIPEKLII